MRGIDDFAAVRSSQSQGGIDIVDPDIWQQPGLAGWGAGGYPCAAHVAGGIVEARVAGVPVVAVPAKDILVEGGGLGGVDRGNLQVTQARARQLRKPVLDVGHGGAPRFGFDIGYGLGRSEERRVGKQSRSLWSP